MNKEQLYFVMKFVMHCVILMLIKVLKEAVLCCTVLFCEPFFNVNIHSNLSMGHFSELLLCLCL